MRTDAIMILPRRILLCVFAVMSSCGAPPDGSGDTPPVAEEPQADPPSERSDAPDEDVGAAVLVGFVAQDRFTIWNERATTLVFDRQSQDLFRIDGYLVAEPLTPGSQSWTEANVSTGVLRHGITSSGTRAVLRTDTGFDVIDLGSRGRVLASANGEAASSVHLVSNGEMLAVATGATLELVDIATGAHETHAISPTLNGVDGAPRSVRWRAEDGASVVLRDRQSGTLTVLASEPESPIGEVVVSSEGDVIALTRNRPTPEPAVVEIHRLGREGVIARAASPKVEGLRIDEKGEHVVWMEPGGDDSGIEHIHALDVASGAHIRFRARGPDCAIAPEYISAVRNGRIFTDGSCSIGCPSVRWDERTLVYDVRTGALLSDKTVAATSSYNDLMGEKMDAAEAAASKHSTTTQGLLHRPSKAETRTSEATFLFASPAEGLRLTNNTVFEDTMQGSIDEVAFSDDGALLAGTIEGKPRVWNADTGRALWPVR